MGQSVNKEQIYHQKIKQSVKNLTDSLLICCAHHNDIDGGEHWPSEEQDLNP